MKYIYFPNLGEQWFQLPRALHRIANWEPTIVMGVNRRTQEIANQFINCKYYDFWKSNVADFDSLLTSGGMRPLPGAVLTSPEFDRLRFRILKMMDRQDPLGGYRLIDREAAFYRMCAQFYSELVRTSPDFVLSSEAPHSPAQAVLAGLADISGVPVFFFDSLGFAPIVFLRDGVNGPFLQPDARALPPSTNVLVSDMIRNYCSAFTQGGSGRHPAYMHAVLEERKGRSGIPEQALYYWNAIKVSIYREMKQTDKTPLLSYMITDSVTARTESSPAGTTKFLGGYHSSQRVVGGMVRSILGRVFAKCGRLLSPIIMGLMFAHRVRKIWDQLERAHENVLSSSPQAGSFALFALHYEPERTTNPQGGLYCSQYDAINALRNFVPAAIPILIREHPTQFYRPFYGYLGRSPGFYKAIEGLDNVRFISPDEDQFSLMRRASLVATITGSIALEAALLGTPALTFGRPWYAQCPGIVSYPECEYSYQEVVANRRADLEGEIVDFLLKLASDFGIPGSLKGEASWDSEVAAVFTFHEMTIALSETTASCIEARLREV